MKQIYETYSAEETAQLGRQLGKAARPSEVYALIGELGVGKTALSKGIAEGLGVTEPVSSPTFTIVQIYEGGRMPLYHFDVYRVMDPLEMEEIGYEDYFYGDGLTLIEWAGQIKELLPEKRTEITIQKDLEKGFDYRRITVAKAGGKEADGTLAGGCDENIGG